MKDMLKRKLPTVKHGGGLVMLWMLCILWHWKPAACGKQDVSEEAEAWASLDLPTGQ